MAVSKTKQPLNLHVFLAYLEELEVEDMMLVFVIKQKIMNHKDICDSSPALKSSHIFSH